MPYNNKYIIYRIASKHIIIFIIILFIYLSHVSMFHRFFFYFLFLLSLLSNKMEIICDTIIIFYFRTSCMYTRTSTVPLTSNRTKTKLEYIIYLYAISTREYTEKRHFLCSCFADVSGLALLLLFAFYFIFTTK